MSYIQINKNNFFHNLEQFNRKAKDKKKIGIVLKDNAYGHGLILIAKLSKEFGLTEAIVKNIQEAIQIKKYFKNILILNDKAIFCSSFSFAINSLDYIKNAEENSIIELKINTGMNRNGIEISEIDEALSLIKKKKLILKGVMTHFRRADEDNSDIFIQIEKFKKIKEYFKFLGFKNLRFHSHNSSASIRFNIENEDFIRIGIGAYGYSEFPNYLKYIYLKPVLSLWANKVATRFIKKGDKVGYGNSFKASKNMIISSYNLGYGDFPIFDAYENISFFTIDKLPFLGKISMNYISLEGDKDLICIFNNAIFLSKKLNTISYKILTQLNLNISRKII